LVPNIVVGESVLDFRVASVIGMVLFGIMKFEKSCKLSISAFSCAFYPKNISDASVLVRHMFMLLGRD
jgi:hypothetical protein